MTPQQAVSNRYDARIRRAEKLISEKSSAAEILSFYRRLAEFQRSLLIHIVKQGSGEAATRAHSSVRAARDLTTLLPHFPGFLSLVSQHAPSALAGAAHSLAETGAQAWMGLLSSYWEAGGRSIEQGGAIEQFFPRAFLQPYAEFVAERTAAPPATATLRACPLCDGRPLLGVLRLEGDGGKRYLVCSFCGHEWEFRRILCPACGEEDEKKLPVYVAEQFPHVRVEACETCKSFVRTIDLTKNGHAVPLVDDLAAVSLTLWADEHGYTRVQPNLLGS